MRGIAIAPHRLQNHRYILLMVVMVPKELLVLSLTVLSPVDSNTAEEV